MMGRPRKNRQDNRLPNYVYLKKGRYVSVTPLGRGKLGPEIVLAPGDASVKEVWAAYDSMKKDEGVAKDTLRWLCEQYLASLDFACKAPTTKADYLVRHNAIISRTYNGGKPFGDMPWRKITPGVMLKYRDKRGLKAPARANMEMAYVSIVFSWHYERDSVKTINPVKRVKRLPQPSRTRLIEDWEYQVVYRRALSRPKATYLAPAMELAYLMRLRKVEILTLLRSDCAPGGVLARRRKGSRHQIVDYSERLEAATAVTPSTIASIYVLHNRHGQPITKAAFDGAWNRLMNECLASGDLTERFHFHDIKAMGVSNFDGDIQDAAGHKSRRTAAIYDRSIRHVKPTK